VLRGARAGAVLLVVLALVGPACSADGGPPVVAATTPASPSASASSASPSSTTGRPTTTTTTAPPPEPITIAFSGDLLPHSPLNRTAAAHGAAIGRAYDFTPLLAPMASVVEGADLGICHMEVPVAPSPDRISSYPMFGAPAELVTAVRAVGYDGCSTASNHSVDKGFDGVRATLDTFDLVGLHHAGTARTAEEAAVITTYEVRGIRIAHLSYAYGFNGLPLPAEAPWAANQIDVARIRADAARARSEGAALVVVSLHWGAEYQHEPSAEQEAVAAELLPSEDIDLVIGHHAHVVQPVRQVGPTYVVFGLGNELSNQTQVPRRDGLTVVATAQPSFGRWRFTGLELVPTWVDLATHRVLPVVPTLADPATPPTLAGELRASYDRTVATATAEHPPGVGAQPLP
jgi:poly-gamma-glutamate synthesis protein (capsule biosynthesis protein)